LELPFAPGNALEAFSTIRVPPFACTVGATIAAAASATRTSGIINVRFITSSFTGL
jgi:hypothetical protein